MTPGPWLRILTLLGFSFSFASESYALSFSLDLTPEDINRACLTHSPVQVVDALERDGEKLWILVLDRISTGSEPWLQTAPCLRLGAVMNSNVSDLSSLDIALATALPLNPVGVVELAQRGLPLKAACSFPFIEPEDDFSRAYFAKARKALKSIHEETYETDRLVCEFRLQKIADRIRESENKTF